MSRVLIGSISTVTPCSAASWQAKRRLRTNVRSRRARSSASAASAPRPTSRAAADKRAHGVAQAGHEARRELVLATRQRSRAAIAGGEIARRRVDQHHLEVVLLDPRDDFAAPGTRSRT